MSFFVRSSNAGLRVQTEKEQKERFVSHYIVYFTQFNVVFAYSTIITGIWPYLNKLDPSADKSNLGYLLGLSALGQTIFAPILGYWSNYLKSTRIPFVVSLIICLISYIIHATLETFDNHRKYWFLFSRFLAGTGGACITLCRSHVSTTTLMRERRKAVSILSSCSTIALALGPALQFAVVPLGDEGVWLIRNKLKLDMYTAIGWIVFIITVINIILFHPAIFKEHSMLKEDNGDDNNTYTSKNYKYLAWVFIVMNFCVTFNFMFTKLLGTPMAMDEFAMTRPEAITLNSLVMCVTAAISFISILLINPICKLVSEMKLLIFGMVLLVVGRFCFYPLGGSLVVFDDTDLNVNATRIGCPKSQDWCSTERRVLFHQFIIGNVLENIGYSFAITLIMAIFSKVLGSRQQGTWMGFLTSMGSIARITSPIFISTLYKVYGPSVVVIVTNLIFLLFGIALVKLAHDFILGEEAVEVITPTIPESCKDTLLEEIK